MLGGIHIQYSYIVGNIKLVNELNNSWKSVASIHTFCKLPTLYEGFVILLLEIEPFRLCLNQIGITKTQAAMCRLILTL